MLSESPIAFIGIIHAFSIHLAILPAFLFLLLLGVDAQNGPSDWTATPFSPPSVPIAVRNPYLNGWMSQGNSPGAVTQTWTRTYDTGEEVSLLAFGVQFGPNASYYIFFFSVQVLEWYAAVRVDGSTYKVYGNSNTPSISAASEKALKITPTRSSFLLEAGSVDVNMTFLSPIEVRLS